MISKVEGISEERLYNIRNLYVYFEQQMRKMSSEGKQGTDWDRILDLHNMMRVELGKI